MYVVRAIRRTAEYAPDARLFHTTRNKTVMIVLESNLSIRAINLCKLNFITIRFLSD